MTQPTALYRHYDARGRLLYVGISLNAVARFAQHRDKPWFADIARMSVRQFPTRQIALAAEAKAIVRDRPIFNIQLAASKPKRPRNMSGWSKSRVDSTLDRIDGLHMTNLFTVAETAEIFAVTETAICRMVQGASDEPCISRTDMLAMLELIYSGRLRDGEVWQLGAPFQNLRSVAWYHANGYTIPGCPSSLVTPEVRS